LDTPSLVALFLNFTAMRTRNPPTTTKLVRGDRQHKHGNAKNWMGKHRVWRKDVYGTREPHRISQLSSVRLVLVSTSIAIPTLTEAYANPATQSDRRG
jgi:hypothetical protein